MVKLLCGQQLQYYFVQFHFLIFIPHHFSPRLIYLYCLPNKLNWKPIKGFIQVICQVIWQITYQVICQILCLSLYILHENNMFLFARIHKVLYFVSLGYGDGVRVGRMFIIMEDSCRGSSICRFIVSRDNKHHDILKLTFKSISLVI